MKPTTLDPRLLAAGLTPTPELLRDVFFAHWPFHLPFDDPPQPTECPTCGHVYTPSAPECPTAATVRPLLGKRRFEKHGVVDPEVWAHVVKIAKLLHPPRPRSTKRRPLPVANPAPGLFDVTDEMRAQPGRVGVTP